MYGAPDVRVVSHHPDGFSGGFYMSCWDVIKNDILQAAIEFFQAGNIHRSFCCTSIFLIPKKPYASGFTNYKPISLCNYRKMVGGNIILKLDMEKAYDKMEWCFIKDTLLAFDSAQYGFI
ncbi:uncharacterized protein LOC131232316 [Magnolia sinica]|uniref:uncharacterized protein LOC131232316 n=1 Tax=Magnolia sinica TaxID=86752 RepID=UPI002658BC77|nr:uncharacterized protein LOC131232316 [Magnolia sinica]